MDCSRVRRGTAASAVIAVGLALGMPAAEAGTMAKGTASSQSSTINGDTWQAYPIPVVPSGRRPNHHVGVGRSSAGPIRSQETTHIARARAVATAAPAAPGRVAAAAEPPFLCYVKNPPKKPYTGSGRINGDLEVRCDGDVLRQEAHVCLYRYYASDGSGNVNASFCASHDFVPGGSHDVFTAFHACDYTSHPYGWRVRGYWITTWYDGFTATSPVVLSGATSATCF